MEYVYAALLLDEAGKEVSEHNLLEVVKAAGFAPNEAKAKAMVESLKGVSIKEIIKNAQTMQVAQVQAQATVAAAATAAAKKPKVEEKKTEEEAAGGLAGLFG